ncbi:MAG: FG-GAP-like repeat-containing protein [Terriglobia bacterium]
MSCHFPLSIRKVAFSPALALICVQLSLTSAQAQKAFSLEDFKLARPRITQPIDDTVVVRIPGSRPRVLDRTADLGRMDGSTKMRALFLLLKSSPEQEHGLQTLLDQQQDVSTPNYHGWLTPDEFGAAFGVGQSDLQQITDWLTNQGFAIQDVARGRRSIMFSGTASQVEDAFHTEMHNYLVDGERHISNSADISIPEALSPVVAGVVSLNDFKPRARQTRRLSVEVRPDRQHSHPVYTDGSGNHYITPGDFAIIYNTQPLLAGQAGSVGKIDGTGQTIGIAGLSDISLNDNATFRQIFVPSYNANNVNVMPFSTSNCSDPGLVNASNNNWELEADLDIEWAGAIAPGATIAYVPCDQLPTSARYLVQSNIASVMSVSAEGCEAGLALWTYNTLTYNQFFASLWEQAAAQGISVFVAAGDNGSAGCDTFGDNVSLSSNGYAVNGVASTPYNVAVGGTMFNEGGNSSYWSPTNYSTAISNLPFTSALSYIPETTWNESSVVGSAVDILAGSGGVSTCYAKPPWQTGPGVPGSDPAVNLPAVVGCPTVTGQHRYLPDVSLSTALHDGYVFCDSDGGWGCNDSLPFGLSAYAAGGTSIASPAFAGIQALVDQQYTRQGQADYVYYALAISQTSPDNVFNDVTTGNNGVPCLVEATDPDCPSTGTLQYFAATPGYDLATGLGSVNAVNLIQQWNNAVFRSTTTTLQVTSPVGGTANSGETVTLTASVYVPSSQTSSQEWGLPLTGWTVAFSDASNSTQLGTGTLTYSASTGDFVATFTTSSLAVGAHNITATFPGNVSSTYYGSSTSAPVTVTVQQPSSPTGTIQVKATFNGAAWPGSASYQLAGPSALIGTSVPATISSVTAGNYSFTYSSGGPSGATLSSVTPSVTQTLSGGGTITYTLNFTSSTTGTIQVNATLNESAWSGSVSYQLVGPDPQNGTSVPATFSGVTVGDYSFKYSSGGPSGATLSSVTPSVTQTLSSGGALTYTLNFTATQASYTLAPNGVGQGTVASTDGKINCTYGSSGTSGACSASYTSGTTVTMNATAASGWTFSGWSSSCSGGNPCVVVMNSNLSPTATFAQNATLTYTITGQVTAPEPGGLSGVTVLLSGSASNSTTTSGSGNYAFTGLAAAGTYTVTPSLSGYTFSPASYTFSNLSANQTAANFTAQRAGVPQNPVPFVNQPLVPASAAPSGSGITLTVNGTGFVSGATVNWNGRPLPTTFESGTQLTAAVPAADLASSNSPAVTVKNPTPGGGLSNVVYFPIGASTPAVSFLPPSTLSVGNSPVSIAVGDFNGDGKADLAVENYCVSTSDCSHSSISILLGNGDGTFTASSYPLGLGEGYGYIAVGDFNGDGKLDLAIASWYDNSVTILLGNRDGTFTATASPVPTGQSPTSLAVADFNGDGKLDLAVTSNWSDTVTILLGNGDGTFTAVPSTPPTGRAPNWVAVGDFNGAGKLDLAVANECASYANCANGSVSILLGDGTGNFTLYSSIATGMGSTSVAVGDVNGDGKLDLAVTNKLSDTVTILLGNGDGTFTATPSSPGTGTGPFSVAVGDFNDDGKLDLAVTYYGANTVGILLGNGDGTFTPFVAPSAVNIRPSLAVVGDFNGDGKLDVATVDDNSTTISTWLQTASVAGVTLSPVALTFSGQLVGTPSGALPVTLTNGGGSTVTVYSMNVGGTNAGDFAVGGSGMTCSTSSTVAPYGGTCTITVTFTPFAPGTRTATLTVTDNASNSPQTVSLIGTGIEPSIAISSVNPSSITLVKGGSSQGVTVNLTRSNNYTGSVTLTTSALPSGVTATYMQPGTGNWGSITLQAASNATVVSNQTITITASGSGVSSVTSTFSLTVNPGSSASVSPQTLNFASQRVNTISAAQAVTLASTGTAPLTISKITASGDFSQTNNCGSSVSAGSNCAINVTFTPTATGTRSGTLTITDNAPNSPQTVTLSGTGTGPAVSLSCTSINFSAQMEGTSSSAQAITLTNSGNAGLSISGITVSGDFSQTNNCGSNVSEGANCTISVTFKPTAGGTRSGSISISDNAPGSPQAVALSGTGQDFTVTSASGSSPSATVSPGQSATYTLSVASEGGMNQPLNFTCTGAPSESACTVSPSTVTPGSSPTNITVSVTTTAPSPGMPRSQPVFPGSPLSPTPSSLPMLTLLLAGVAWALHRWRLPRVSPRWAALVSMAAGLLLALAMAACGGGAGGGNGSSSNSGTPGGTYTITVTGTTGSGSSTLSHSVVLTLTVS